MVPLVVVGVGDGGDATGGGELARRSIGLDDGLECGVEWRWRWGSVG